MRAQRTSGRAGYLGGCGCEKERGDLPQAPPSLLPGLPEYGVQEEEQPGEGKLVVTSACSDRCAECKQQRQLASPQQSWRVLRLQGPLLSRDFDAEFSSSALEHVLDTWGMFLPCSRLVSEAMQMHHLMIHPSCAPAPRTLQIPRLPLLDCLLGAQVGWGLPSLCLVLYSQGQEALGKLSALPYWRPDVLTSGSRRAATAPGSSSFMRAGVTPSRPQHHRKGCQGVGRFPCGG